MFQETGDEIPGNESTTSFPEIGFSTVSSSTPISTFDSKLPAAPKPNESLLFNAAHKPTASPSVGESYEAILNKGQKFSAFLEFGACSQPKEISPTIFSQKPQVLSSGFSETLDFSSNQSQFLGSSFMYPRSSTPTDSPSTSSFSSDLSDAKLSNIICNKGNTSSVLNQPTRFEIKNKHLNPKTINLWGESFVNSSTDLAFKQFSEMNFQQKDECESTSSTFYTTAKDLKTPEESITDADDIHENKNSSAKLYSKMLIKPESSSCEFAFSAPQSTEISSTEYLINSTNSLSLFTPFDTPGANRNSPNEELSVDQISEESFEVDIYEELSNFLTDTSSSGVNNDLGLSVTSLDTKKTLDMFTKVKENEVKNSVEQNEISKDISCEPFSSEFLSKHSNEFLSTPELQENTGNVKTEKILYSESKSKDHDGDYHVPVSNLNEVQVPEILTEIRGNGIQNIVEGNGLSKNIPNVTSPNEFLSMPTNQFINSFEHTAKAITVESKSKEYVDDNIHLLVGDLNTEKNELLIEEKGNEIKNSIDDYTIFKDISNRSSPNENISKKCDEFINLDETAEHALNTVTFDTKSTEFEDNFSWGRNIDLQNLFNSRNNACMSPEKEIPVPNPLIIYVQNNKSSDTSSGNNFTEEPVSSRNIIKEENISPDRSETKTVCSVQQNNKKRKNSDRHLEDLPNKRILVSGRENGEIRDKPMTVYESCVFGDNGQQTLEKVRDNTAHDLRTIRPYGIEDPISLCRSMSIEMEQSKSENNKNVNNNDAGLQTNDRNESLGHIFASQIPKSINNTFHSFEHRIDFIDAKSKANNISPIQSHCVQNRLVLDQHMTDVDHFGVANRCSETTVNRHESDEVFKNMSNVPNPTTKECIISSKNVSKESIKINTNTGRKKSTTADKRDKRSPCIQKEALLNANPEDHAIGNEESIHLSNSPEFDEIEIIESSEMDTSSFNSSDFSDEDTSPEIFFQEDLENSPLENLFAVNTNIAKAVAKALSQQKGITVSQIRNFITQRKLVKLNTKVDKDIRQFLKAASELDIIQKVGLKYHLKPLSKATSKQKSSDRKNEPKTGIKKKNTATLKKKTPISRRLETLRKKASNSPKVSSQRPNDSASEITSETQKKTEVFKKLRSRIIIVDSDS